MMSPASDLTRARCSWCVVGMTQLRTILVTIGALRSISDISGLYEIRMDGSVKQRQYLFDRLRDCRCDVSLGGRWTEAGDFVTVLEQIRKDAAEGAVLAIGDVDDSRRQIEEVLLGYFRDQPIRPSEFPGLIELCDLYRREPWQPDPALAISPVERTAPDRPQTWWMGLAPFDAYRLEADRTIETLQLIRNTLLEEIIPHMKHWDKWGTRLEPVTREQWDLRNQVAFIESRVKVREEYRRAVEAVADRQGISSEQSDVLVLRFVQLLVNRLREDSDDAVLAESVVTFVG